MEWHRTALLVFGLLFFWVPGLAIAQDESQPMDESEETFYSAVMHFSSERIEEAVKDLDRSISLDDTRMEAFLLRAICRLKLNRLGQAREDFESYLALDAEVCEGLNVVGKLWYMYGFLEEAEGYFRRALVINDANAVVLSNLGSVMIEQQRFDEAKAFFLKAVESNPDLAEAHVNLGILYFIIDEYTASENAFLRAIELNENQEVRDPIAYANLGDLYFAVGEFSPCVKAYTAALAIDPNLSGVRTRLGMAFQLNDQRGKAREQYETAIALGKEPPEAHSNLAILLLEEGRVFDAVEEYRWAIKLSGSSDPAPILALADIWCCMEKYDEALHLYRKAYELGEQSPRVLSLLSRLSELQGRRDEAIGYFARLLEQDLEDPVVLLEVARRCAESGLKEIRNPRCAVKLTRKLAEEMGWKHPGVMNVMAQAYATLGDFVQAAEAQGHVVESLPKGIPLTLALTDRLEEYRVKSE
jgi:tetratricopeptide (TPR) repeat protein